MKYRVSVELKNGRTEHMGTLTAMETDVVADKARKGEYWNVEDILVVLPEMKCTTHGWAYMEAGVCTECMDEFYHSERFDPPMWYGEWEPHCADDSMEYPCEHRR